MEYWTMPDYQLLLYFFYVFLKSLWLEERVGMYLIPSLWRFKTGFIAGWKIVNNFPLGRVLGRTGILEIGVTFVFSLRWRIRKDAVRAERELRKKANRIQDVVEKWTERNGTGSTREEVGCWQWQLHATHWVIRCRKLTAVVFGCPTWTSAAAYVWTFPSLSLMGPIELRESDTNDGRANGTRNGNDDFHIHFWLKAVFNFY